MFKCALIYEEFFFPVITYLTQSDYLYILCEITVPKYTNSKPPDQPTSLWKKPEHPVKTRKFHQSIV